MKGEQNPGTALESKRFSASTHAAALERSLHQARKSGYRPSLYKPHVPLSLTLATQRPSLDPSMVSKYRGRKCLRRRQNVLPSAGQRLSLSP